jgi:hypothetical protein
MIPIRLIAKPTNTTTMRPPTLEVIATLNTAITQPSKVINTPAKVIFFS